MAKKREGSPAFQFYASDFVAEVAEFDADEVAIYTLLKCKDWMETGFAFDEARLARVCKVSVPRFRSAWVHLAPLFPAREGRHYHPGLEAERVKQANFKAAAQAGAFATNRKRWGRQASPGDSPSESGSDESAVAEGSPSGRIPFPSPASAKAVGARARGNGNGASNGHYAPGHVNLPKKPFCDECGDGVLVEVPGQRRPTRQHADHCSRHLADAGATP